MIIDIHKTALTISSLDEQRSSILSSDILRITDPHTGDSRPPTNEIFGFFSFARCFGFFADDIGPFCHPAPATPNDLALLGCLACKASPSIISRQSYRVYVVSLTWMVVMGKIVKGLEMTEVDPVLTDSDILFGRFLLLYFDELC